MAQNVTGTQTWAISTDHVPVPLQNKIVTDCFLEMLNLSYGANHAILRVVFKHPQLEASPRAPANTLGLVINLEINGRIAAPSVPGDVVVRTHAHVGTHLRAVRSIPIPVRGKKRVRHFLAVIRTAHLLPCFFDYIHPDAVGCRDFTSQFIYHLDQQKVLKLPANAANTVYDAFNYRYSATGIAHPHQAPRALFGHHRFEHVIITAVNLAP
ncbi:unnamed protein product [Penicillium salamii]|uniref:Uncharacterized protein n=1 Tax=Penicillium salamii TaxID=1612424 RepID=A0A9W4IC26_9EURO|nr:unnamed protein product [Penicillium salamii]